MDGDGLGAAALRHAGVLRGVGVDGGAVDAAVARVAVLAREQLAEQSPARRRGADVGMRRAVADGQDEAAPRAHGEGALRGAVGRGRLHGERP